MSFLLNTNWKERGTGVYKNTLNSATTQAKIPSNQYFQSWYNVICYSIWYLYKIHGGCVCVYFCPSSSGDSFILLLSLSWRFQAVTQSTQPSFPAMNSLQNGISSFLLWTFCYWCLPVQFFACPWPRKGADILANHSCRLGRDNFQQPYIRNRTYTLAKLVNYLAYVLQLYYELSQVLFRILFPFRTFFL